MPDESLVHDPLTVAPEPVAVPQEPESAHEQYTTLSEYLESLLVTVILALFGTSFVVQAFKIPSPSMEKTGGRDKPALLADVFEAIVAAMYLDGGLNPARDLLKRTVFEQALEDGARISESDRKSALQEFLQAKGDQPAEYRLAGETGPDHQKRFRVEVWVKGEFMSSAEGTTKKEAEQRAARSALDKLLSAEAKQREEVGPNAG